MRRLGLLPLLLLLSGCAVAEKFKPPPLDLQPLSETSLRPDPYRDVDVPMTVEAAVDLDRYIGIWHEVARFPDTAGAACAGGTVTYSLRDRDRLSVLETCPDAVGAARSRAGVARVLDPGGVRWRVRFSPVPAPLSGRDYWILDVDPAYRTAVIGAPDGRSGRVLSRQPRPDPAALERALSVLRANGYDLSRLVMLGARSG